MISNMESEKDKTAFYKKNKNIFRKMRKIAFFWRTIYKGYFSWFRANQHGDYLQKSEVI
jgi:hypothetical protein